MKILFSIVVGIVIIFSISLGLILVGKILERIGNQIDWLSGEIFQSIIGVILMVICFGLIGLSTVLLVENFQLELQYCGYGIVIGMFLYIPFSKWAKVYN